MSSSSKKKQSKDKVPTKLEANIDIGNLYNQLTQYGHEQLLKVLEENPEAQTIMKYYGRPFPKDELIKRHRDIRQQIMEKTRNKSHQYTFKNNFVQQQMKPELEIGDTLEYTRIFVKDLVVGTTHKKKVFRAKVVEPPLVMDAIHIIVEDANGDVLQVSVYNTGIKYIQQADKQFKVGYELAVYDPFMKAFANGGVGIRVENPNEIYIGRPRQDLVNFDYQQEGDLCFQDENFEQALKFYTLGLKNNPNEIAKLLGNISACLIKKSEFLAGLLYAYTSVRIDEIYEKGWFRISNALTELGRTDELKSTFKLAPIEIQGAFNILNSLKKNNQQQPMQSFFCPKLSDFVRNKSEQINGSFEELKTQGNEFFRNQEFSKALNCYLNALDLEKEQISKLFKNRSACYLKLNEFLNAAIDSSASFLLQPENNEQVIYQKASALREMGQFQLAKQSIQGEEKILNQSQQLQKLLQDLKLIDQEQLPKVKNTYKSKKTVEDDVQRLKNKNKVTDEQYQKLAFETSFLPKQGREMVKNLMVDSRVPNFQSEYFKEGHLPPHCDLQLSNKWLLQAQEESNRVSKKLEMDKFIYENYGKDALKNQNMESIPKRLGIVSKDRFCWWCEAEFGDVNFLDRSENYPQDLLHSFSNVWPYPMDLTHGTVHVAVGYVDLGQLLTANFHKDESNTPLQFIGYEQSAYCTAKTLVIGEMLKQKICPKAILQIWYSSGWSLETLEKFRQTIEKLLQNNKLEEDIVNLLRHWLAAPRVSLLEAQKQWLKFHPGHGGLSANTVRKNDRIEITTYVLTGRLLECEVGSLVMFANPPSYPHLSYDEKVTWLLKEEEIIQYKEKFSTIIGTFIRVTLERIEQLSEKIRRGKIQLDLRLKGVFPNDKKVHHEIKNLQPYTMSWSNLADYFDVEKFHQMAKSCSADKDTVHFVHSTNWVYDVKGAMSLDYAFEQQQQLYKQMCDKAFLFQQFTGQGEIFLLPPVDHPWNIMDGFLTTKHSQLWAEKFYEAGGVIPKCVAKTISFPYSIFCRGQGNLYMIYTYDKSVNFQVPF